MTDDLAFGDSVISILRSQTVISKDETNMSKAALVAVRRVDSRIHYLRDQKIILDADLSELYGVTVKRLNEQVKRNLSRFPSDFLFQLTRSERDVLRSQIATSNTGHGGRRYLPYAFTEHGAIMAATVLNSTRAIQMSIFVVRAFVHIREALATSRQIVVKLAELERRIENHDTNIRSSSRPFESLWHLRRGMAKGSGLKRHTELERPTAEDQFH